MSNVKHVSIAGFMPFDADDDQELLAIIGRCAMPLFGLNIDFNENANHYVEHADGVGRTLMLAFNIHGIEAVNYSFIDRFLYLIKNMGGSITNCEYIDVEA